SLLDGQWQRFDPTAAVAPSRIERGLGAALPAGELVPYFARLEMTWIKSLRLRWDAVNYQWQRGVVGFNLERQRDLLRDFGFEGARPWQIVAVFAGAIFIWGVLLLGAAQLRRSGVDAEVALWNALCRRLARSGLARAQEEGPLAYTRCTRRRCGAARENSALQERLTLHAASPQPRAQPVERLRLNLTHPFSRDAQLARKFFQRGDIPAV